MFTEKQVKRRQYIKERLQQHKPMRECLGCGSQPKLAYQSGEYTKTSPPLAYPPKIGADYEAFILHCPNCGYRVGPFMDLQPVITAWHMSNLENSPQHLKLWQEEYNQLIAVFDDPSVAI